MRKVARVVGRAVPLARADVDTDQIIPASYLKQTASSGYGAALFAAWRADPTFVLNDERYRGATVLVAGPNFGCGSSREHAAWALRDAGFEAVVSSSLADIFRGNCVRNGVVPVTVPPAALGLLFEALELDPALVITVDVAGRTLSAPGLTTSFALEDHARRQLVEGLDDVALTLAHAGPIGTYEAARPKWLPVVTPPA